MLLVPTEVKASPIHGLGCFALEDIPKGTEVWEFSVFFDKIVAEADAEACLPELAYDFLTTYAWQDGEYMLISGDQSRYLNHAAEPNCGQDPNEEEDDGSAIFDTRYAVRDIKAGEELTEFYLGNDTDNEEDDDDDD